MSTTGESKIETCTCLIYFSHLQGVHHWNYSSWSCTKRHQWHALSVTLAPPSGDLPAKLGNLWKQFCWLTKNQFYNISYWNWWKSSEVLSRFGRIRISYCHSQDVDSLCCYAGQIFELDHFSYQFVRAPHQMCPHLQWTFAIWICYAWWCCCSSWMHQDGAIRPVLLGEVQGETHLSRRFYGWHGSWIWFNARDFEMCPEGHSSTPPCFFHSHHQQWPCGIDPHSKPTPSKQSCFSVPFAREEQHVHPLPGLWGILPICHICKRSTEVGLGSHFETWQQWKMSTFHRSFCGTDGFEIKGRRTWKA